MRVVEAGALLWASTSILAETALKVVSIDRHEGYGPSTLAPFMSNMFLRQGLRDKVVPVIGDATKLVGLFNADRYFIDLDGTFETSYKVLDAIPYRVPVAIHDFARQRCQGVEPAILATGYTILETVDTLAICVRR